MALNKQEEETTTTALVGAENASFALLWNQLSHEQLLKHVLAYPIENASHGCNQQTCKQPMLIHMQGESLRAMKAKSIH